MGVGAGLYMCDVVKKVHVRYLISWWVLVSLSFLCLCLSVRLSFKLLPYFPRPLAYLVVVCISVLCQFKCIFNIFPGYYASGHRRWVSLSSLLHSTSFRFSRKHVREPSSGDCAFVVYLLTYLLSYLLTWTHEHLPSIFWISLGVAG